jgi:hypothetical protein
MHLSADAWTLKKSNFARGHEHPAFPGGSRAVDGLQAYSGGTRHRLRSWLITSDMAEREEVREHRPLNDARGIL